IDVVIEQRAVAVVDDVLDPTDVDLRRLDNALDRSDHVQRRFECFDLQTGSRRVNRTRYSRQFNSIGSLANVCGAEIERLASGEDLDSVKILSGECFNSRDVTVARRHKLLD